MPQSGIFASPIFHSPIFGGPKAGGAAFSPLDIASLVGWYDFSDIATLFTDSARTTPVTADGDAIGGVTDKSVSGWHALQTVATRKMTFKTEIQNGLSVARYDGGDGTNTTIPSTTFKPVTIMAVVKHTDNAPRTIFSGNLTGTMQYRINATKANLLGQGVVQLGASTSVLTNAFNSLSASYSSGGAYAFRTNGAADGSGTNNQTIVAATIVQLGSRASAINAENFLGDMGEVCIFSEVLSAGDIASMETYLNGKWAVY